MGIIFVVAYRPACLPRDFKNKGTAEKGYHHQIETIVNKKLLSFVILDNTCKTSWRLGGRDGGAFESGHIFRRKTSKERTKTWELHYFPKKENMDWLIKLVNSTIVSRDAFTKSAKIVPNFLKRIPIERLAFGVFDPFNLEVFDLVHAVTYSRNNLSSQIAYSCPSVCLSFFVCRAAHSIRARRTDRRATKPVLCVCVACLAGTVLS